MDVAAVLLSVHRHIPDHWYNYRTDEDVEGQTCIDGFKHYLILSFRATASFPTLPCGESIPRWKLTTKQWIDYRLNLIVIFLVMGFVAHSPPNYAAAQQSLGVSPGPVITQNFVSQPLYYRVSCYVIFEFGNSLLTTQVNGMMNMVCGC